MELAAAAILVMAEDLEISLEGVGQVSLSIKREGRDGDPGVDDDLGVVALQDLDLVESTREREYGDSTEGGRGGANLPGADQAIETGGSDLGRIVGDRDTLQGERMGYA